MKRNRYRTPIVYMENAESIKHIEKLKKLENLESLESPERQAKNSFLLLTKKQLHCCPSPLKIKESQLKSTSP